MRIHNWTGVPAGLFHHFHQTWSVELTAALNRGRLPKGVYALVEQRAGVYEPDILAIETTGEEELPDWSSGANVATLAPPTTQVMHRSEQTMYVEKANRIVVRHHRGSIVAVIEIVSPGNKDSETRFDNFVSKTLEFLRQEIHVLIIDLFPPSPFDPRGIHEVIWRRLDEDIEYRFPPRKSRLFVSYKAGAAGAAYIEPLGLDDNVPDMPLFLNATHHVRVPLAESYDAAWNASPAPLRNSVERQRSDGR